jgi:hypothetical protein
MGKRSVAVWANIPNGVEPGEVIKLEHQGLLYEIVVPDNLGPDRRVSVNIPIVPRRSGPWWNPTGGPKPSSYLPVGGGKPNFNNATAELIGELSGLSQELCRELHLQCRLGAFLDWKELTKNGRRRVFGLGKLKLPKLQENFQLGPGTIYRAPRSGGQRPYGKSQANTKCPHGRSNNGYTCRECNGEGLCVHKRVRSRCKLCLRKKCEHGVPKIECTQGCAPALPKQSQKCPHGKSANGRFCIECNGKGLCPHKKNKYYCKICRGSQARCKTTSVSRVAVSETIATISAPVVLASRGRKRKRSYIGRKPGKQDETSPPKVRAPRRKVYCPHGGRQNGYYCVECNGKGVCVHGNNKFTCRICRKKDGGPSISNADLDAVLNHAPNKKLPGHATLDYEAPTVIPVSAASSSVIVAQLPVGVRVTGLCKPVIIS